MANDVYTVQGKQVYENEEALPSVVSPDDAWILNTAMIDNRLEWQGREALFENGQWVTRDQVTSRIVHHSQKLSETWLWLNNWSSDSEPTKEARL